MPAYLLETQKANTAASQRGVVGRVFLASWCYSGSFVWGNKKYGNTNTLWFRLNRLVFSKILVCKNYFIQLGSANWRSLLTWAANFPTLALPLASTLPSHRVTWGKGVSLLPACPR